MDLQWLAYLFLPVVGHVLYGLPPDPAQPDASDVTLHNGDGFSAADDAPQPERLRDVRAVTTTGSISLTASGSKDSGVVIDVGGVSDRPSWIVVETPRTFIELAPESFSEYLAHEGLTQVLEARETSRQQDRPGREIYSKYCKTALNHSDGSLSFLESAIGLPIEIVPVTTGPLHVGDILHVRVLVDGRPTPHIQLRACRRLSERGEPKEALLARTDDNGDVPVVVDGPGLWRLHAIAMAPHGNPAVADWESLWASLTFRL